MMKKIYLIAVMCLMGTLLLPCKTNAQYVPGDSGEKPAWASPSFYRTLDKTYLEVVVISRVTKNPETIINDAEEEIIRRRKMMVGENDPWIKSGYIASYWEEKNGVITGYFLYQTRKNPSNTPELIQATTDYGFSPRVFIPGAQQIWKGQTGKATFFILGEVACVGGIVLSESLSATYSSKKNDTYNSSEKQQFSDKATIWKTAGYGFITGAAVLYVWNIIDGIVSPGRPTIKYNNKILSLVPSVSPDNMGMALTLSF